MNPVAFYDSVAGDYDAPEHERFYRKIACALLKLIQDDFKARSVLEIGAGSGFATLLLRERFSSAIITALEPSQSMLARAERKLDCVSWRLQKLADFDGSSEFDLIFCSMAGHWLSAMEWVKLLDLSKSSRLALAIPISDRYIEKATGNEALRKVLRKVRSRPIWPKDVRVGERILARIEKWFSNVHTENLVFTESFSRTGMLADALYSRGVLVALCGEEASVAKSLLEECEAVKDATEPHRIGFNWAFKLIIACDSEDLLRDDHRRTAERPKDKSLDGKRTSDRITPTK